MACCPGFFCPRGLSCMIRKYITCRSSKWRHLHFFNPCKNVSSIPSSLHPHANRLCLITCESRWISLCYHGSSFTLFLPVGFRRSTVQGLGKSRGALGHIVHFDALSSKPKFDHEDQWPKLRACEGEDYDLWNTSSSSNYNATSGVKWSCVHIVVLHQVCNINLNLVSWLKSTILTQQIN